MSDLPFSIPTSQPLLKEYVKIQDLEAKIYGFIDDQQGTAPEILGATGDDVTILESSSSPVRFDTSTGKYTVLNDGVFLVSIAVRGGDTTASTARQRLAIYKNDVRPDAVSSFMPRDNAGRHYIEMSQLFVCSAGDTISVYIVDNVPNVGSARTIYRFEMFVVKIY